jgi:hypothetical protein
MLLEGPQGRDVVIEVGDDEPDFVLSPEEFDVTDITYTSEGKVRIEWG